MRAKRRFFRPTFEQLEDRVVPSRNANAIATFEGTIAAPTERDQIPFTVRREDFDLVSGKVVLGFAVQGTGGNLDPTAIRLLRNSGSKAAALVSKENIAGTDTSSLLLARLSAGSFAMDFGGTGGSTGSYLVEIFLAGDANGDFKVDKADLDTIKALKGSRRTSPLYTLGADVNRDGIIKHRGGGSDRRAAKRNIGAATNVRPLFVRAGLSDASDPDHDATVLQPEVTVEGQTTPGARVRLDQNADGTFEQETAADNAGLYQFDVMVADDLMRFRIEADDAFGQSSTAHLDVTRTLPLPVALPLTPPADPGHDDVAEQTALSDRTAAGTPVDPDSGADDSIEQDGTANVGDTSLGDLDRTRSITPPASQAADTLTDTRGVGQVEGKVGNAAHFRAADQQYFSAADSPDLSLTGDFTISGWIYLDAEVPGSDSQVLAKMSPGNISFRVDRSVGSDRLRLLVHDGTATNEVYSNRPVPVGAWTFFVAWHDAANDQIGIQINDDVPVTVAHATGVQDSAAPLLLGALGYGPSEFWNGAIDEVAFWKRVLTAEERAELYQRGNGNRFYAARHAFDVDSGGGLSEKLVTYYTLDEPSGNRLDAAHVSKVIAQMETLADQISLRRVLDPEKLEAIAPALAVLGNAGGFAQLANAVNALRGGSSFSVGGTSIVNGDETASYPSVGIVSNASEDFYCTGTLISPSHVLTAAHCAVGVGDRDGRFTVNGRMYSSSAVHVHPDYAEVYRPEYDEIVPINDLAIYQLAEPISDVTPSLIFRGTPEVGQELTIVGFGAGGTGLEPHHRDFGTKRVGTTAIDEVHPTEIVWHFDTLDESDTARGDSGGPAFVKVGDSFYIAGVTSWGSNPQSILGDEAHDVRVDSFADWIDGIVGTGWTAFQQLPSVLSRLDAEAGEAVGAAVTVLEQLGERDALAAITTVAAALDEKAGEIAQTLETILKTVADGGLLNDMPTLVGVIDEGAGADAQTALQALQLLQAGDSLGAFSKATVAFGSRAEAITNALRTLVDILKTANPQGPLATFVSSINQLGAQLAEHVSSGFARLEEALPIEDLSDFIGRLNDTGFQVSESVQRVLNEDGIRDAIRIGNHGVEIAGDILQAIAAAEQGHPLVLAQEVIEAVRHFEPLLTEFVDVDIAQEFAGVADWGAKLVGLAGSALDIVNKLDHPAEAAVSAGKAVTQLVDLFTSQNAPINPAVTNVIGAINIVLASFQAGNLIGGQLPDTRLGGTAAGAGGGAAVGFVLGGPVGAAIGALTGGLGGLFGSRDADHAFKAARLAADQLSQANNVSVTASFWTEMLGASGYANLDGWAAFVQDQVSKVNAPAQPFSYEGLTGNMDQAEAIAFVASRLLLQQIHQEHPEVTSLDQVPGFREAYIQFIMDNYKIERGANVVPVEDIRQAGGLLTAAGFWTPGTTQHGSLPFELSQFYTGMFDWYTGAPMIDIPRVLSWMSAQGINVPANVAQALLDGPQSGVTAQIIMQLVNAHREGWVPNLAQFGF